VKLANRKVIIAGPFSAEREDPVLTTARIQKQSEIMNSLAKTI